VLVTDRVALTVFVVSFRYLVFISFFGLSTEAAGNTEIAAVMVGSIPTVIVTVLVEVYIGTVTLMVVDTVGVILIVCSDNPVALVISGVAVDVVVDVPSDVVVLVLEVIVSVLTDALVVVFVAVMSGLGPVADDRPGGRSPDWPARKGLPEICVKSIQAVVEKKFDNSN